MLYTKNYELYSREIALEYFNEKSTWNTLCLTMEPLKIADSID